MIITVIEYAEQQLAATGWAAINLKVAQRLRPTLAVNFGAKDLADFAELLAGRFPGVQTYHAQIKSIGSIKVLARYPQFLAERMTWIIGLDVSDVMEIDAQQSVPVAGRSVSKNDDASLARLRTVAAQELPVHDCDHRRAILGAMADLERLGVNADPAVSP